jgi:hypothetical protein
MKVFPLAALVATTTLSVSICEASAVGKRVKGRILTVSTEPGTTAEVITITSEADASVGIKHTPSIEHVEQAPKGSSAPKGGTYEEEEEEVVVAAEKEVLVAAEDDDDVYDDDGYDDDDGGDDDDDDDDEDAPASSGEYNEEEEVVGEVPALYEDPSEPASQFEEAAKEGKAPKENYNEEMDDEEEEEEDGEYVYYEEEEGDKAPKGTPKDDVNVYNEEDEPTSDLDAEKAPKEKRAPKERAPDAASKDFAETQEVPISTTTTTTTTTTVVVTTVKEYEDGSKEYEEEESVTYSSTGGDAAGDNVAPLTTQVGTVSAQAASTSAGAVVAVTGEEAVQVGGAAPKEIFAPKSKEDRRIRPYSMTPRRGGRHSHDEEQHEMANRRRLTLPAPTLSAAVRNK